MNHGASQLIEVLLKVAGEDILAALMDVTLSAECDERLDDREAELACMLFDRLTDARPDLIRLAQRIGSGEAGFCEFAKEATALQKAAMHPQSSANPEHPFNMEAE